MPARFSIPWIDACRTRRTVELLFILWMLALTDLFFTIWAQLFTPFTELNPLASHLLKHHELLGLVLGKIGLTAFGTAIFWFLRKHGRTEIALWALVLVYVGLTFRWSHYTTQVLALGAGTP